jgi:hypothetical protein
MKQVLAALIKVGREVNYVQKRGYNDFQKYSYVTEADVLEVVRPQLLNHGLLMIPTLESTQHDEHGNTHITVRYDIYHESGETLSFVIAGSGNDRNSKGVGDKGIYKALTGANKYALLRLLQLATGDDAEVPNAVDDVKESKQSKPQPLKAEAPKPEAPKTEAPKSEAPEPFVIIKEHPNALADQICSLAEAFLDANITVDQLRKFYSINKDTWTQLEKMDADRLGLLNKRFMDRSNEIKKANEHSAKKHLSPA